MTLVQNSIEFACNMCGFTMKYNEPKVVMADADGHGSLDKLDIHICSECRPDLLDFANGKIRNAQPNMIPIRRDKTGKFTKKRTRLIGSKK